MTFALERSGAADGTYGLLAQAAAPRPSRTGTIARIRFIGAEGDPRALPLFQAGRHDQVTRAGTTTWPSRAAAILLSSNLLAIAAPVIVSAYFESAQALLLRNKALLAPPNVFCHLFHDAEPKDLCTRDA